MLDLRVKFIISVLLYLLFRIYISCRKLMWNCRGKIDPSPASRYITTLVHAHVPGPVDAWRDFPVPVRDLLFDMFTVFLFFRRVEVIYSIIINLGLLQNVD